VGVDPTINPQHMEMYADILSRGGVLEPEGTVEIKFRSRELIKAMRRLDPEVKSLAEKLGDPALDAKTKTELESQLLAREQSLLPIYTQVAIQFADLHDTAGRMQEKGVINDIVEWKNARRFFYWRLRRLLLEDRVKKLILKTGASLPDGAISSMLRRWLVEDKGAVNAFIFEDNKGFAEWLESQLDAQEGNSVVSENIKLLGRDAVIRTIRQLVSEHPEVAMDSVIHIMQTVDPSQRQDISKILANMDAPDDGEEGATPRPTASRSRTISTSNPRSRTKSSSTPPVSAVLQEK